MGWHGAPRIFETVNRKSANSKGFLYTHTYANIEGKGRFLLPINPHTPKKLGRWSKLILYQPISSWEHSSSSAFAVAGPITCI